MFWGQILCSSKHLRKPTAQLDPSCRVGAAPLRVTASIQVKFPKAPLFHFTNKVITHRIFSSESYCQKYMVRRLHFDLNYEYYSRDTVHSLALYPCQKQTNKNKNKTEQELANITLTKIHLKLMDGRDKVRKYLKHELGLRHLNKSLIRQYVQWLGSKEYAMRGFLLGNLFTFHAVPRSQD